VQTILSDLHGHSIFEQLTGLIVKKAANMLHWLHSLLPHIPRYGYVLVFIVVFLNNLGLPLPGESILLGAGFVLGKFDSPIWQPMAAGALACFLGGICAFWIGRRLGHSGLEEVRWLHLTAEKVKWPERFFRKHGAKAVLIARFIPLFPPVAANLLAGMSKIPGRIFLLYNLAGSLLYTLFYILIGYFFGKKWRLLEVWLGPTALYLIVAAIFVLVLGSIFRHPMSKLFARSFFQKRERK